MDLISIVDNEFAWVSAKGRYYQAQIYRRGNQLFVKVGGGFVGLHRNGTTTLPNLIWHDMTMPVYADKVGRLLRHPEPKNLSVA